MFTTCPSTGERRISSINRLWLAIGKWKFTSPSRLGEALSEDESCLPACWPVNCCYEPVKQYDGVCLEKPWAYQNHRVIEFLFFFKEKHSNFKQIFPIVKKAGVRCGEKPGTSTWSLPTNLSWSFCVELKGTRVPMPAPHPKKWRPY